MPDWFTENAPADEAKFRAWYAASAQRYQLDPNPDSPEQKYDYRSAFKAGATPDASGHWPSDFKQAGHPNEVVGGFNTRTGERVAGTPQASESELVRLGWDAETAKTLSAKSSNDWFSAQAPAAKPAGETDAQGNRIVRNPDGSVKFMQGPGFRGDLRDRLDSNVATIGGFGIAPEDAMMAPGLARGAASVGRKVLSYVPKPSMETARIVGSLAIGNPKPALKAGVQYLLDEMAKRGAPQAAQTAGKAIPAAAEAAAEAAPVAAKVSRVRPDVTLKMAKDAFDAIGEVPLLAEASNARELILIGKSPEEDIQIVMRNRPAAVQRVIEVAKKLPPMTSEEVKLGQSLMARGKTFDEAMAAIQAQRAFKAVPGVQSNAERIAAQDSNWASGKVKTPSAETARARRQP